jgi:hypothetical protein
MLVDHNVGEESQGIYELGIHVQSCSVRLHKSPKNVFGALVDICATGVLGKVFV